jgi:hypothetical protein
MEDFSDVAKARETYTLFVDAMNKGREILLRSGVAEDAPPVPGFDAVFQRLDHSSRRQLFSQTRALENPTTVDALRIWQPLIKTLGRPRQ